MNPDFQGRDNLAAAPRVKIRGNFYAQVSAAESFDSKQISAVRRCVSVTKVDTVSCWSAHDEGVLPLAGLGGVDFKAS